jgi:hypothetical protein
MPKYPGTVAVEAEHTQTFPSTLDSPATPGGSTKGEVVSRWVT